MSDVNRRFITLPDFAARRGVHEKTVRNWIGQGYFPVYRLHGARGVLIDVDEAEAALAQLPPSKVGRSYGSFGPNAVIRDLRKVVQ